MISTVRLVRNTINFTSSVQKMKARGPQAMEKALTVGREMVARYTPVDTGALVESILNKTDRNTVHEVLQEGNIIVGTFGTILPYARRLEFGFEGVDSLGRVYHQAATGFFSMGMMEGEDEILKALADVLNID